MIAGAVTSSRTPCASSQLSKVERRCGFFLVMTPAPSFSVGPRALTLRRPRSGRLEGWPTRIRGGFRNPHPSRRLLRSLLRMRSLPRIKIDTTASPISGGLSAAYPRRSGALPSTPLARRGVAPDLWSEAKRLEPRLDCRLARPDNTFEPRRSSGARSRRRARLRGRSPPNPPRRPPLALRPRRPNIEAGPVAEGRSTPRSDDFTPRWQGRCPSKPYEGQ